MNQRYLATAGITSTEARSLQSLLQFLRNSLDSEWFVATVTDPHDAVLIDLDSEPGRNHWELSKSSGAIRIAVSNLRVPDSRFIAKRPWHQNGEHALVSTLNAVDAHLRNRCDSNQLSSVPVGAMLTQSPRPANSPASSSAGGLLDALIRKTFSSHSQPAAVNTRPPIATDSPAYAGSTVATATVATAPGTQLPLPLPAPQTTLLGAVEKLKNDQQPGRICITGLPPIFIDGPRRKFSAALSLANLLRELRLYSSGLCEIRQIQPGGAPAAAWQDLAQLEWLARLTSPYAPSYEGNAIQLVRWPQFIQYPCEVAHLRMASILLKQQLSIPVLAELTESTPTEVATFVHACELLGLTRHVAADPSPTSLLDRSIGTSNPKPGQPNPLMSQTARGDSALQGQDEQTSGKVGLFKRILSAIRLRNA